MDDLISRQGAIDAMYKMHMNGKKGVETDLENLYGSAKCFSETISDAVEVLEDMPTVAIPHDGEYISKHDVIDIIKHTRTHIMMAEKVRELPSVAIPSKVGRWIWDGNTYRCSCCNHFPWRVNTEENDEIFTDMKRTNAYKFCPNCGADMRGEQHGIFDSYINATTWNSHWI